MNLIGQPITHCIFGAGVVTDLTEGVVTIGFEDRVKKFVYPDAFSHFLALGDQEAQRHIEEELKERDIATRKARALEQEQEDLSRKRPNFTVNANSHAVFHVTTDQIDQVRRTWQVSTGTFLSGNSKGRNRTADRLKPNSVCLITTRPDGMDERERCILGAFMVKEDFFGEADHGGVIEGHPQYRILAPQGERMLFWAYFGQNTSPRWGNRAFRYCSKDVINAILTDLVKGLTPTDAGHAAMDFYRYFCKMNQLHPLIKAGENKSQGIE